MRFEQKLKKSEAQSQVDGWGEGGTGIENNQCKSPEVGWGCHSQETWVQAANPQGRESRGSKASTVRTQHQRDATQQSRLMTSLLGDQKLWPC